LGNPEVIASNLLLPIYILRRLIFDQRAVPVAMAGGVVVDGVEVVEGHRPLSMEVRRLPFPLRSPQEVVEHAREIGDHQNPTGVRVGLLQTVAD
jgi:hypothetical protein